MDDIVKRIRQQSYFGLEPYEAANEIEQLRQRVAELEMSLAETEALEISHGDRIEKLNAERDALKQQRDELVAALVDIQQVACSGSPELGIASDAIASVKEK